MIEPTDSTRWGRSIIHYSYSFSDRKTLEISVHPNLRVEVTAPCGTDLEAIREKVKKRASWIKKSQREFELYLPKQPPRRFIAGETHRYLGRQYRLKLLDGSDDTVKCYQGCLWVTSCKGISPDQIENLIEFWYRERAKAIFNQSLAKYVPRILGVSEHHNGMIIRKMKYRWGSCTKSGKIILNLELIKAPKDCIEYVVVHELCHLIEHNHGSRFWKLVEKAMPEYLAVRHKLNRFADYGE